MRIAGYIGIGAVFAVLSVAAIKLSSGSHRADLPGQSSSSDQSGVSDPSGIGRLFVRDIKSYPNKNPDLDDINLLLDSIVYADGFGHISRDPVNEIQDVQIMDIKNGSVEIGGTRILPSAVVTVNIKTVNRSAGSYGNVCVKRAAVMDTEFHMLRHIQERLCAGNEAYFADWAKEHGIQ